MAFDLFIAGILLVTTIRGAAKGVAWQLAGIGALVLCFMFATPLSLTVAPMIKLAPPLNRWVAMLGIYLVFSFGTFAIARGFRDALEKAKFVEFDRHLGALFGLAKGAILALVITFFSVAMSERAREMILKTYTGYASAHIMNALDPVMPRELHAILEPYIHHLDAVDPDLAREREEHHQHLDAEEEFDQEVPSRSTTGGGYRPVAGKPNSTPAIEEDDALRDPFQGNPEEAEPPPFNGNRPRPRTPLGPRQSELEEPVIEEPSLADEALQILKQIPSLASKVGPAIKQQVQQAWDNTLSEHREEFADELRNARTPEHINSVATRWQNGRPKRPVVQDIPADERLNLDPFAGNAPPATQTSRPRPQPPARNVTEPEEDLQPQRQELLKGIARIFSSQSSQQAKKMTEIETSLLGLPDTVAVGVLSDWLSDLRGEDPDPDPHTDVATQLNVRIARQIDQQQIPPERLPQEWQTRLERYLRN